MELLVATEISNEKFIVGKDIIVLYINPITNTVIQNNVKNIIPIFVHRILLESLDIVYFNFRNNG